MPPLQKNGGKILKICEYCMAEFEPKRPDQKYCRPKCASRFGQFKNFKKRGKIVYTRICPKCNRLFMTIDENKFNCQDCISNDIKERLENPKKKGRCDQNRESHGARFGNELRKVCGSNEHEVVREEVIEYDAN